MEWYEASGCQKANRDPLFSFDGLNEHGSGLERRNLVLGNDDGGVLGDVACSFGCASLHNKTSKATEKDILSAGERILYNSHELLNHGEHGSLLDAGRTGNLVHYISFCHFLVLIGYILQSS